MAKTWSADNPKAALMARKRAVIVDAALKAFLDAGYAEASVNQIAATAGVSIKTLYRHFESKDDLFSAVMQAACGKMPGADIPEDDEPPPAWYDGPPAAALPNVVGATTKRRPAPATPNSPAISICGQSARAGGCATSTPQPRCLPDC